MVRVYTIWGGPWLTIFEPRNWEAKPFSGE